MTCQRCYLLDLVSSVIILSTCICRFMGDRSGDYFWTVVKWLILFGLPWFIFVYWLFYSLLSVTHPLDYESAPLIFTFPFAYLSLPYWHLLHCPDSALPLSLSRTDYIALLSPQFRRLTILVITIVLLKWTKLLLVCPLFCGCSRG